MMTFDLATISLQGELHEQMIEEFAVKQVIRLKKLGLQDVFRINKWRLGPNCYNNVRTRCCKELEEMKSTMVVQDISLCQVLSQIHQPFILPTEYLLDIYDFLSSPDLLTRFPLYGDMLRSRSREPSC